MKELSDTQKQIETTFKDLSKYYGEVTSCIEKIVSLLSIIELQMRRAKQRKIRYIKSITLGLTYMESKRII